VAGLVALGAVLLPNPAQAAVAASITANGAIAPGLTPILTAQSWSFAGTVSGLFELAPGSCAVTFHGSSNAGFETTLGGSGHGTLACSGTGISLSCSVDYSHTASTLSLDGTCTGSTTGRLTTPVPLAFAPSPCSTNGVVCQFTLAGSLLVN
jgi:hypothetical protein